LISEQLSGALVAVWSRYCAI